MQGPKTSKDDPTVIVGMACRVPGATNPDELWDLIIQQRDVQRKIPEDRWIVDNFYHVDGANKGTTNARHGYFLDQDIRDFDASFFGISGKEAEAMDPQQRLLLEVVYEALENAGITLDEVNGSNTSVFCGCFTKDYDMMIAKDWDTYPKHTVTGTGGAILANRISYFYNLMGTSVTADTACSSSLVCLHLGRQSILNGESDMSIIVGSSLHFDPREYLLMTNLGMLSKDGRSRAFDVDANGYVRGEGICAVVLKRQSVAEANSDNIRAVVRATGTNHDGRTQGITLPSPEAQEALIRSTYASVGLDFKDTQYFEAHGTGTQAGDPRETSAIGAVFAPGRKDNLYIGSVKTNIGHLEGSSGLAGLIKTTMALEHQQIPPNMLFNHPNPKIKFEEWKLLVPTKPIAWKTDGDVRRASVNSFGYGGTNAHVILEEYHPVPINGIHDQGAGEHRPYLIPLTSHSAKARQEYEKKLQQYLHDDPDVQIEDVALSFAVKRTLHKQRSFLVAEDIDDVVDHLTQHRPDAGWTTAASSAPRLGFVFTGQGGQWYAMGRQLILSCKLFRQTLDRCDEVLQQLHDAPAWSVVTELLKSKEASLLGKTEYSQPLCTAIQLALVDLLRSWGIVPTAVVGHSSGEMGAAYAAGILSFDNALITAYYRGLYMSVPTDSKVRGSMMAIGMSEVDAEQEMQAYEGRIGIAAINSPSTMTISGDEDAILELKDSLTERKIFCRQLQVSQAFHSHHMFELAPAYEAALDRLPAFKTEEATCRMVSSVTGRVAEANNMVPAYWAENMTNKVKFSQALEGILKDDEGKDIIDILVEIGPHPALKGPSRQIQQAIGTDKPYFASLTRGTPDFDGMLTLAGQLFSRGTAVDLVAINSEVTLMPDTTVTQHTAGKRLTNLPTYSWDHRKFWAETRYTKELRLRSSRHSILGAPVPGSFARRPRWRNYIVLAEHPWLSDHVIDGRVVFPGAGYISMAIEAVALQVPDLSEIKSFQLNDIIINAALLLPDTDSGVEMMLELRPVTASAKSFSKSEFEFAICSFNAEGPPTEHCHGTISALQQDKALLQAAVKFGDNDTLLRQTDRSESAGSFYSRLRALGLEYGERFALLSGTVHRGDGFVVADITFNGAKLPHEYYDETILHATLLDSLFHVGFSAIESCLGRQLKGPFVPTCIRSMNVSGVMLDWRSSTEVRELQVCCNTNMPSRRVAFSDMVLRSRADQTALVTMEGLEVTSLGRDGVDDTGRHLFFSQHWQPTLDLLESRSEIVAESSMASLVTLYTHQHPNATVLHISQKLSNSVVLAEQLGLGDDAERSVARFDVHTPDKAGDKLEEISNGLRNFQLVETPISGSYDLVVADCTTDLDLASLLKEHGVIICNNTESPGLSTLRTQVHAGTISVLRKPQQSITTSEDILAILPDEPSGVVQTVVANLEKIYSGCIIRHTWSSIADTLTSPRTILVLTDLDHAFDSEADFTGPQRLLTSSNHKILWLTSGSLLECARPESATVLGFLRSARSENDGINVQLLDLDPNSQAEAVANTITRVLSASNKEDEMAERGGCIYIPRIKSDDARNSKIPGGAYSHAQLRELDTSQPIKLQVSQFGALDSLEWAVSTSSKTDLGPDEVEIAVKASSISSQDVEICQGTHAAELLGSDCAGIVRRVGSNVDPFKLRTGDRVMAWLPGQGCHATIVRGSASLCNSMPSTLSFAQAATLPSALIIAYYALVEVGRLRRGDRVLVHGAASALGQIAIQIATRIGAEVFATIDSVDDKESLINRCGMNSAHICSSSATEFPEFLEAATAGKGMDVIVCPYIGSQWEASLQCLAPFGRFIDISQKVSADDTRIGLRSLANNCIYVTVDTAALVQHKEELTARMLRESLKLVHNGHVIPPANISEFSFARASEGFRAVQSSGGSKSAVLVANYGEMIKMLPPTFDQQRLFDPKKIYLLVGGLGGLGRSMSEWMFQRGARRIAFLSRSGAKRAEAKATVDWLEYRGVEVQVFSGDVSKLSDVEACMHNLGSDLAGVFHAAMVLQDVPLEKMTYEQWRACTEPKILGAQNLHQSTLHLKLDFFVVFSSVAAVLGSKGQANYAAANSFLDAFIRYRRGMGLSGISINVGAVGDIGVIAENEALQKIMDRMGMDMITGEELMYQLEEAVCSKPSAEFGMNGMNIADEHSIITGIGLTRPDVEWAAKPLLHNLYANHDFGESASVAAGDGVPLSTLLAAAVDAKAKASVLADALMDKMAVALATPREVIDCRKNLSTYGLDSIVAVDFRKWFRVAAGVDIAVFDILGPSSIEALCEKAVSLME